MSEKTRYSMVKAISRPISDVMDYFMDLIKTGLPFALVLLLLSMTFGRMFLCAVPSVAEKISCGQSALGYAFYMLCKLIVLSVFIKTWYDLIYMKKAVSMRYFKENIKGFAKSFLLLVFFIGINMLPAVSAIMLIARVPNPDAKIELLYFTGVSIGFVLPFVLIFFYANLAEFLEGAPWKNFSKVWQNTATFGVKIIFSVAVLFLISMFVFTAVSRYLRLGVLENTGLYNLFSEFVFDFVTLMIMALFTGYLRVQKEIVLKTEE